MCVCVCVCVYAALVNAGLTLHMPPTVLPALSERGKYMALSLSTVQLSVYVFLLLSCRGSAACLSISPCTHTRTHTHTHTHTHQQMHVNPAMHQYPITSEDEISSQEVTLSSLLCGAPQAIYTCAFLSWAVTVCCTPVASICVCRSSRLCWLSFTMEDFFFIWAKLLS